MEEILKHLKLMISKFEGIQTDLNIAELNIRRKSFHALEEADSTIQKGEDYLKEINETMNKYIEEGQMTPEVIPLFQQFLVSIIPKIESSLDLLKSSKNNPPEVSETLSKGEQEFESILHAGLDEENSEKKVETIIQIQEEMNKKPDDQVEEVNNKIAESAQDLSKKESSTEINTQKE